MPSAQKKSAVFVASSIVGSFLLSLFVKPGFCQAPANDKPYGHIDYAITYVPFLHSVVMYGGWSPPRWRPTNEAWTWNGTNWSRWQTANDAPAFAHHTVAFDLKRGVLVVCGRPTPHEGNEYQVWEYDGEKWSRKADLPVSPSALGDPKLTYDSKRNRLVLYVASYSGDAEIWEFDGAGWKRAQFAHRPLLCDDNGCQFQYDESIGKSVLVGESRSGQEPLGWDGHEWGMAGGSGTQTWLWDGADWTQLMGEQPPRAMWGGMTYDRSRDQLVLLTTRMETWRLRRGKWAKLSPANSPQPAPNGFFGLAYDPIHKVSLFFGGENRPSEPEKEWGYPTITWLFDGKTWVSR